MELKTIHESKTVRGILIGLGVAVTVMLIFHFGTIMGYHKARFSDDYGGNFERNFMGQQRGENFFSGMSGMMESVPGGHGAVGEVVSVSLPTFVVAGPDNLEKTVVINDETLVREFRDKRTKEDIIVGKTVVVLGTPNDAGVIEAKLIRIMPVSGTRQGVSRTAESFTQATSTPQATTSTLQTQ